MSFQAYLDAVQAKTGHTPEQLHTIAPPKLPVTSKAIFPQWQDPSCKLIRASRLRASFCTRRRAA